MFFEKVYLHIVNITFVYYIRGEEEELVGGKIWENLAPPGLILLVYTINFQTCCCSCYINKSYEHELFNSKINT